MQSWVPLRETFNSLENCPEPKLISAKDYLKIRVIRVIRDSDNLTMEYLWFLFQGV